MDTNLIKFITCDEFSILAKSFINNIEDKDVVLIDYSLTMSCQSQMECLSRDTILFAEIQYFLKKKNRTSFSGT